VSAAAAPDLVVLDCDGVLVDTERLTVGVEARILTDLGWPMTAEEVVTRWMGRSSASQLAEVEEHLGAEKAREFETLLTPELHTAFERDLAPVDGVPELLDALEAAAVPTCVASSGTHERMRLTLGLTGLWDRFEGRIFSASEVVHGKPAPDLFLHAASQMGVEPARCAVVEDSVYGVQAAVAAGMTVHGFAGGLTAEADLAAAGALTFQQMTDLVELLVPAAAVRRTPGGSG
jgi:HAD superfamily hydrolase (TIGR01509 family)